MSKDFIFTSESVSEGHPDKMSDQISDAILDAIIAQDTHARVACETMVKTGMVVLAGEITTSAIIDYEPIVREVVNNIGYNNSDVGFDGHNCAVLNALGRQSPDIAQGVDRANKEDQGAGDQGLMFGYASNETDVLMPAPIAYAHRLVLKQAEVRRAGSLPWLRPDAKSQVTFRYENDKPVGIDAVVLSTQHDEDVSLANLQEGVMEEIIKPVLPSEWLDSNTQYHINPTGKFVIGVGGAPMLAAQRFESNPCTAEYAGKDLAPQCSARERALLDSVWRLFFVDHFDNFPASLPGKKSPMGLLFQNR